MGVINRGRYRCEECDEKKGWLNLVESPYEIHRNIKDARAIWRFCSVGCLKVWVSKQSDEGGSVT